MRTLIVEGRQTELLEMVHALQLASGFSGRLHGRQQQANQKTDDCDYHQQLDQRKGWQLVASALVEYLVHQHVLYNEKSAETIRSPCGSSGMR